MPSPFVITGTNLTVTSGSTSVFSATLYDELVRGTHWRGDSVGPRSHLYAVTKTEIPAPAGN